MRYDSDVIFIREVVGGYDPNTSKKTITEAYRSKNIMANKNPLDKTTTSVEFGNVERDISVLRIRHETIPNVTHAIINNIKYKIVRRETLRHDQVFYIESVI